MRREREKINIDEKTENEDGRRRDEWRTTKKNGNRGRGNTENDEQRRDVD